MVWASDQEEAQKSWPAGYGKPARDLPRLAPQKSQMMLWLKERWQDVLAQNSERIVLWLPVGFAFGAGVTGSVRANDTPLIWVLITFGLLLSWFGSLLVAQQSTHHRRAWAWTSIAALSVIGAAFSGGGAASLLRAQAVAAPVIADARSARLVTGYVVQVDKSQRGAWRATINVSSIAGVPARDRPAFVRISLSQDERPLPGSPIVCSAILRPPPGPVVPGAYDHSRRAWFQRLGGVGFALKPCTSPDLGDATRAMDFKQIGRAHV